MRTFLKLTMGILLAALFFFGVAIFILTKVVDPNDYKTYLDRWVSAHTGRHLLVQGKIHWSFIPHFGIDFEQVTLTNPSGFAGPPLVEIGDIHMSLPIWPLLIGKVHIHHITINNAHIHLAETGAGEANWGHWETITRKASNYVQRIMQINEHPSQATLPIRDLIIDNITIHNATLTLMNQKTHSTIRLAHLNLDAQSISFQRNFPITITFLAQQSPSQITAKVTAKATGFMHWTEQLYTLASLTVHAKIHRPQQPFFSAFIVGDLIINLPHETLNFSPLTIRLANMPLHGFLQIQQLFQTPQWTMQVSAEKVALGPWIKSLFNKDNVQGTLSLTTELMTSGHTPQELLQHLNGKGNIQIFNGLLLGIDMQALLDRAEAAVEHKSITPKASGFMQTALSDLSATYVIQEGILHNDDLKVTAGATPVTGLGSIDFNHRNIQYILTAHYYPDSAQSNLAWKLPIVIRGDLLNPQITPDFSDVARKVISNQLKGTIKKYAQHMAHLIK